MAADTSMYRKKNGAIGGSSLTARTQTSVEQINQRIVAEGSKLKTTMMRTVSSIAVAKRDRPLYHR